MIRVFTMTLAICVMCLWGQATLAQDQGTCGGVDSAHVFRNQVDSWCIDQNLRCCKESETEAVGFVGIGMESKKRHEVEVTWEQLATTQYRRASIKIELAGERDQLVASELSPALSGLMGKQESFTLILDDPKQQGRRLRIIVPSAGDYGIAIRSVIIK